MREVQKYVDARESDIKMMVDVVTSVVPLFPDYLVGFERQTEFISLTHPDEFALYRGDIKSTDTGKVTDHRKYKEVIKERIVPHSTSKWTSSQRSSFAVGALARCNNNAGQLNKEASALASALGFKPVVHKPFFNNVAQLIETVHCYYEAKRLIDELLDTGWKHEPPQVTPRAGRGVGVCEAPRGLLIHDYTYDDKGIITEANCIVPTCENHGSIEDDIRLYLPAVVNLPQDEMVDAMEKLIRAYDPCISCSAHFLKVEWK
jgi:coenzyme F420-reducing hydrogenase alpha subunit